MIQLPLFENTPITIVFYLFCCFVVIHLSYLLFFFLRLPFYKNKPIEGNLDFPSVSVVICGRNEFQNLMDNLQSVLEQDYPNFEVVVVNHASVDDSAALLFAFQREYSHLRVINVNRSSHTSYGKKFPLSIGIKAAKNEWLVLTDADCKPNSNQWLKGMSRKFATDNSKEINLGYGPMNKKKGLLNWFIRMETTYIAINYFSYALAGVPYMSVGRNFAYSKSIFQKNRGFRSHYSVISGDDDLFLQEVAKKKNLSIEIQQNTWCYSEAKTTWKDWFIQKRRHYTASPKYKFINKLLLGSYNVSWLMTLILFIILLFDIEYSMLSFIIFTSLFILRWVIYSINFGKLKSFMMSFFFPFWELSYMLITPFIYFVEDHSKSRWK